MFFVIVLEIRGLLRPYGFLFSRDSLGGSVARAREANVSIIKFTHNICTAFNGESWEKENRCADIVHLQVVLCCLLLHIS